MKRVLLVFLILSLTSCQTIDKTAQKNTLNDGAGSQPKNIILLIGDGMGPQQISAAYYLARFGKEDSITDDNFGFKRIADRGFTAISMVEPLGHIVVDSACSATQLAIGQKTHSEFIGVNRQGNTELTILEKAKKRGMATGLVSDARITHATPASFAAHSPSRHLENLIASSLLETQPDVMFSGGARHFIPKGVSAELAPGLVAKSRRKDDRNLLQEAENKGYEVVHTLKDMRSVSGEKVLGLFSGSGMPDSIWQNRHRTDKQRTVPNLEEMTGKALTVLEKNKKGFFLMVEGGQIDWAAHANDAGWLLHEMSNFNRTLNHLMDYVDKHPETLLVVTADHETGGFGFSYSIDRIPEPVEFEGDHFPQGRRLVTLNYVPTDIIDKLYRQKQPLANVARKFGRLPKEKQTANQFKEMIEENIEFKLSDDAAQRILKKTENRFQYSWLKKSQIDKVPYHPHGQAFYTNIETAFSGLIAKELATQQNVVFATGGHTATPVYVFSYGAGAHRFQGYTHHSEVGLNLQKLLGVAVD